MKIRTILIDAEQDGRTYAQIIGKPDWTTVAIYCAIMAGLIGLLIEGFWPVRG